MARKVHQTRQHSQDGGELSHSHTPATHPGQPAVLTPCSDPESLLEPDPDTSSDSSGLS